MLFLIGLAIYSGATAMRWHEWVVITVCVFCMTAAIGLIIVGAPTGANAPDRGFEVVSKLDCGPAAG
jgi:hypothetical protein